MLPVVLASDPEEQGASRTIGHTPGQNKIAFKSDGHHSIGFKNH